jgi:hypothetical protein
LDFLRRSAAPFRRITASIDRSPRRLKALLMFSAGEKAGAAISTPPSQLCNTFAAMRTLNPHRRPSRRGKNISLGQVVSRIAGIRNLAKSLGKLWRFFEIYVASWFGTHFNEASSHAW